MWTWKQGIEQIEVACSVQEAVYQLSKSLPLYQTFRYVYWKAKFQRLISKNSCLYCGKKQRRRRTKRYPLICQVQSLQKICTVRSTCGKRNNEWSRIVRNGIDVECDLVSVESHYHKSCDSSFAITVLASLENHAKI